MITTDNAKKLQQIDTYFNKNAERDMRKPQH